MKFEVILLRVRDRQFIFQHMKELHKKRTDASQQLLCIVGISGDDDPWKQRTEIKASKETCGPPQEGEHITTESAQHLPAYRLVNIFESVN